MMKRVVSMCLCLALLLGLCPRNVFAASVFNGVKGPTLVKHSGIWYYIKDGKIARETTLVKYYGGWYYVKNGTTQSSLTSLVKWNGEWWYVVNGKVASRTTTLVKYNGEWFYVVKGKIASNTTTLVKYNNEWWYVIKGKVAGNTTTLVKYNGGWYYIVKGKLAAKTTTLVKYNGSWYYVENGKVNFSATTLCSFNGQKYYVKNGVAQIGYTGKAAIGGKQYSIRNGAVVDTTGNPDLWKELPKSYSCGSREEWQTYLYIKNDGSFTGQYVSMTDENHNYDGIMRVCPFRGQFSTPKRINSYMYEVKVTGLTVTQTPGKVYYDEYGDQYLTISEHDDIEKGDVFCIYLPGTPMEEAPYALAWYFSGEGMTVVPEGYASLYNKTNDRDFMGCTVWDEYR